MPPTLTDMLLLLELVKSSATKESASRQHVIKRFNDMPIRKAHIPDYGELERLCVELGLLLSEDNMIGLTQMGDKINACSGRHQEVAQEFVKGVIRGPDMGDRMHSVLSKFHTDCYGIYWYPKKEIYDLFAFPAIMPILYEIGLLEKDGSRVVISPEYVELISRKITQENLEDHLLRRKKIGVLGEQIALEFEKDRLAKIGCVQEAARVKLVSEEFANAGYDMESFDRDKNGEIHRIYVEIKASTGDRIDFHWSANEIKKARLHEEDYWIYFVPGIDERTKKPSGDPIRFQNPCKTIFDNTSFKTEPDQYHVFENRMGTTTDL